MPLDWNRHVSWSKSNTARVPWEHLRSVPSLAAYARTTADFYVSTGGFTREARYEADRSNVPMRLLDLDGFVRHYVDVYDKTNEETRDILPLTRIWWPA